MTEQIVDRLVLEVLLSIVHSRVAIELECGDTERDQSLYLTWVPDEWTLTRIRDILGKSSKAVRRIVYPGHGLSSIDKDDLKPVLSSFHKNTKLVSFEEALP